MLSRQGTTLSMLDSYIAMASLWLQHGRISCKHRKPGLKLKVRLSLTFGVPTTSCDGLNGARGVRDVACSRQPGHSNAAKWLADAFQRQHAEPADR